MGSQRVSGIGEVEEHEVAAPWNGHRPGRLSCALRHDRGTFVVQGWRVTDPEAITDLIDVRENESYVEIPKTLLRYAEER